MIMATTYHSSIGIDAEKKAKSNFFSNILNRLVEARQEEANRVVRRHLRSYSPYALRSFGYTEEQISEVFNSDARERF
jgi:hypothetical protein